MKNDLYTLIIQQVVGLNKRRMKMMITILCAGSRGDFQPYIALAQELKKLGKKVRITGLRS
ncbi:hypothetical protein EJF36_02240 [Bacillus sp. HMF5848]|nr:hypothetical protein EJF36_02240 [Bacillus sp. HMF5848]